MNQALREELEKLHAVFTTEWTTLNDLHDAYERVHGCNARPGFTWPRLLGRMRAMGLIEKRDRTSRRGAPTAWRLTTG